MREFNALDHHNTIKKVSYRFDNEGRLHIRLIETLPSGQMLFYYLRIDGTWNQYQPEKESTEPLGNQEYELMSSTDVTNSSAAIVICEHGIPITKTCPQCRGEIDFD